MHFFLSFFSKIYAVKVKNPKRLCTFVVYEMDNSNNTYPVRRRVKPSPFDPVKSMTIEPQKWLFFFFFLNLLVQVSNTIERDTESKVLKTLEDDLAKRVISKKDMFKVYTFDNSKILKIPKIRICSILANMIFDITLSD